MVFDINRFDHLYDFDCEFESVGKVHCQSLSSEHTATLTKSAKDENQGSESLARQLLAQVAVRRSQPHDETDTSASGFRLSPEELGRVSEAELGDFCRQFLAKNTWLLTTHDGENLQCADSESQFDFLKRAFQHYADERRIQVERLTNSVSGSLFANSTLDALLRNSSISDQLNDKIEKLTKSALPLAAEFPDLVRDALGPGIFEPRLPELHIPENPIRETNKKLESVVQQIEDLRPMAAAAAQLIRSMNDTALRMQADYIANSTTAGRHTRTAIWIAAVSLLVSAVGFVVSSFFSYRGYVDAELSVAKSDVQIKALQEEIRDLSALQRQAHADTVKALVDGQRAAAPPVPGKSAGDLPAGKK